MMGLVSLLDAEHTEQVHAHWRWLEEAFDLHGYRLTPFPHFSWHLALSYQLPQLEESLDRLTVQYAPFEVRTDGLGVFTHPEIVLYIPVMRSVHLSQLHDLLWRVCTGLSRFPKVYYHPDQWMPHITLVNHQSPSPQLAAILEALISKDFNWQIMVDNLALVRQQEGQVGEVLKVWRFSGQDTA